MAAQDTCSSFDSLTDARMHTISHGPDKWEFLLALADPGRLDPARRRPDFSVEMDEDTTYVYALRINELKRLDDLGLEWAFSGRVDKDADFDNYDSDGCHRPVRGTYNTDSRSGEIALL